jgi:filamentous hemagglutinin family protein
MKRCHFGFLLFAGSLFANPSGPQVTQGNVTVTGVGSTTVNVAVGTGSTVNTVNWSSFSINNGEQVNFSSASSAPYYVMNKITGGTSSQINGVLSSGDNGHIYFVNPSGIVVGPTGTISTGAFVASTLDLVGNFTPTAAMTFQGTSKNGITNQGMITATSSSSGDVVFIGYRHVNTGTIVASATLAQAAGLSVLLQPVAGSDKVFIQTSAPLDPGSGIGINAGGTLQGQSIVLKADSNPYDLAINLTGIVNTTPCTSNEGQVVIMAQPGTGGTIPSCRGSIQISGQIFKPSSGGFGPILTVTGQQIAVLPGAVINLSATSGGGTVNLGSSTATCVTRYVYVAPGAALVSNATAGSGGTINIYASDSLLLSGTVQATGAGTGNTGGSLNVTGPLFLGVNGSVDLSGPIAGSAGTATFNTTNLVVGDPINVASLTVNSPLHLYGGAPFPFGTAAETNIPAVTLSAILQQSNATLNATGAAGSTITVLRDVTWSSGNNLTLNTGTGPSTNIFIHALLSMTGTTFSAFPVVTLISPNIEIGSPQAGVNLTSGNISITTTDLLVQGGATPGATSYIRTLNGTITIVFADSITVVGGSSSGSDAAIQGTNVIINSTAQGVGDISITAHDCSKAYIDGDTVQIGVTIKPRNITIQGGCCSAANEAYIGNAAASTITIVITGDLSLTAGTGGTGNRASVMSLGGGRAVNITATNVTAAGGVGGVNNQARLMSLGTGGSLNLFVASDLNLLGGPVGAQGASAFIEADLVNYNVTRDVHITGGGGQMNSAYIQGYGGITGNISRNHIMTSGTGLLASAELRSSKLIYIDSNSGVSNFVFDASGNNKSFVRGIILGDGDIRIGSNSPLNVSFLAGNGGDPYALLTITGNGNIDVVAIQDIIYRGGGGGNAVAGSYILGAGNINHRAGRDLHLFAGTTTTSDVFLRTTNGGVRTTVGRDTLLIGSCTIPNKAYFLSVGPAGHMFVTSGTSVVLKGLSFIQLAQPAVQINPNLLPANFRIATPTLSVQDCSYIQIGTLIIVPTPAATVFPGKYFYKYVFLYELFYRFNYYGIPRWSLCDSQYFWKDTMFSAP